jgi:Uma2 family endonuclease
MDYTMENIEVFAEELKAESARLSYELSDYEIERGKPMPSRNHSRIQKRLLRLLEQFEPVFEAFPELSLELEGDKSVPDISICPTPPVDWQNDVLRETEPPLLTIEIVSPSQTYKALLAKSRQFLLHGVPVCWIIQPEIEAIIVVEPNLKPRVITSGVVLDKATGISVTIEDIFR